MTRLFLMNRHSVFLLVWIAVAVVSGSPRASGQSPVKLKKWIAMSGLSIGTVEHLTMDGIASHLGKFLANGEIVYQPGPIEGSLQGEGVIVFEAANGDRLAGVINVEIDPFLDGTADAHISISWRDSIVFSDLSVGASTGRFAQNRPPGISTRAGVLPGWVAHPLCFIPR